jgi:hypothetical protein
MTHVRHNDLLWLVFTYFHVLMKNKHSETKLFNKTTSTSFYVNFFPTSIDWKYRYHVTHARKATFTIQMNYNVLLQCA